MLHTVNKSPLDRNTLASCLRLAKPGSAILLIEDGVYGALTEAKSASMLTEALQNFKIFVLEPDLKARGITDKPLIDGINTIDYGGFVDLSVEHNTVQSWM